MFKKPTAVRKFSLWLSHSTSLAPFRSQSRGLPKSLTIPEWSDASSNPTRRSAWSSITSTTKGSENYLSLLRDSRTKKDIVHYAIHSVMLTCHVPETRLMYSRMVSKTLASEQTKSIATKIQTLTLWKMLSKAKLNPRSYRMLIKAAVHSWFASIMDMLLLRIVQLVPS